MHVKATEEERTQIH